jgi:hypothetical protein
VREQAQAALTPVDKAVLEASKAVESAVAKGDASAIRAAMQNLEKVSRGELPTAASSPAPVNTNTEIATANTETPQVATEASPELTSPRRSNATHPFPKEAPRPVVAVSLATTVLVKSELNCLPKVVVDAMANLALKALWVAKQVASLATKPVAGATAKMPFRGVRV